VWGDMGGGLMMNNLMSFHIYEPMTTTIPCQTKNGGYSWPSFFSPTIDRLVFFLKPWYNGN